MEIINLIKSKINNKTYPECSYKEIADETVDEDCFSKKELEKLASKFNTEPSVENIKEKTNCDSQACIIMKETPDLSDRLKPSGPHNTTQWLTNSHIDKTLKKWAEDFEGFYNIPFQMVDFNKTGNNPLNNLSIPKLRQKGYKSWACVVNTDVSTGDGEHWFCFFGEIDGNKATLEFFDSANMFPVRKIGNNLNEWMAKQNKIVIDYNRDHPGEKLELQLYPKMDVRFQKGNSECGVFSLYYIFCRLLGIPRSAFSSYEACSDELMEQFRGFLFAKV